MTLALLLTLAPLLGPACLPVGAAAGPASVLGAADEPQDIRGALVGLGAEAASERLSSQR